MKSIHSRKNAAALNLLLARMSGQDISPRRGARPRYNEAVPEPNRSILTDFYRSLATEELSTTRIVHLMGEMYRISIWLGHRPFHGVTREDLIDLLGRIRETRAGRAAGVYSAQTVESYKNTLRKFWKWLKPQEDPEKLPPEVAWIKLARSTTRVLPKDIWTPEEVNKVASLACHTRDRAFVLGLFGSGCRIGEFLPIRRRDVVFDAYSCQVFVDGKTGPRRVRLTPAASVSLAAWLDVHPNKAPDAPVWIDVMTGRGSPDRHISYDWANGMLKGLAKRAGMTKPIRPHLMRHSLATYYAPRLTEAVMNEHFGWKQGSRTASIYTHLSGKQVDDQILAACGKKKLDVESGQSMDVVRCWQCGLENPPSSLQCGKCGFPLSDEACRKLVEKRQNADDILDFVTRHPEVMGAIRRALAEDRAGTQGTVPDAAVPRGRAPAGPAA
jgi:integrase